MTVAGDCDDADPNNFTGNAEVCDGQDNNCDTIVPLTEIEPILAPYAAKKGEILKLYEETPGLDGRYRKDAVAFLEQWYKMMDNLWKWLQVVMLFLQVTQVMMRWVRWA